MARKKAADKTAEKAALSPAKALSALEQRFAKFKPASVVFDIVHAVQSIFLQLDFITRVGGWPTRRVGVVHGPSNEGKTQLLLGLAKSFLNGGHFVLWGDAERTTTKDWVVAIMGDDFHNPRFRATKPRNYEAFVDEVRDFCETVAAARDAGECPADTTALIVVDSLKKLVPEGFFKKIAAEGAEGEKGSVDGMGGRGAQIKAAMNASWLDELVPLMDDTKCAIVFVVRETDDPAADKWTKMAGNDYKTGGGKAVYYDSALVVRVERAGYVVLEDEDESTGKKTKRSIGERHSITIKKTKIAGKEDKVVRGYFHTLMEDGTFDTARDVVELALRLGVMKLSGSYVRWEARGGGFKGKEAAVEALRGAPDDLAILEQECRASFDQEPEAIAAAPALDPASADQQ